MTTSRRLTGQRAKRQGQEGEAAVDESLNRYQDLGFLVWDATYPKVGVQRRGSQIVKMWFERKGGPDRIITLSEARYGEAIAFWLEVKTLTRSPNKALLGRVHQYYSLFKNAKMGGYSGYLVHWRAEGNSRRGIINEWRYHPIQTVSTEVTAKGEEKVRLERKKGLFVPEIAHQFSFFNDEDVLFWPYLEPDWLQTAIEWHQENWLQSAIERHQENEKYILLVKGK